MDAGDTASPAHPPLPPPGAGGRPGPGSGSPHSFQRMFPYLACQVSGERASEMQQEPLGGKLELTVPCLALPPDSLTEKLFVARAWWPASPLPPPSRPLPAPPPAALGRPRLQCRCPAPGSRACRRALPLICAVWTTRVGKAGFSVPAESTGRPRAAGLFLSYQCRNAAAAAAGGGGRAAAWAVGRQGSPEGAPSPLRSSRSVREPSRTQRGELEEKKGRKGKERGREKESERSR